MGQPQRMIGVLFDDQHGEAVLPVQGPDGVENLPRDQRRQARAKARPASTGEGGSSARARSPASAVRRRTACRRAGSCVPSAAGTARTPAPVRVVRSASLLSVASAPICRFSATLMRGKIRRPSGDCAIRSRAISWVGKIGDVAAVEQDLAGAGARLAEDRHHQGRLAGAVGADQGDDLARTDVDVDALQRLDLAVGGAQAADREQRRGSQPAAPARRRRLPRPRRRDRPRSPWDRRGRPAASPRRS